MVKEYQMNALSLSLYGGAPDSPDLIAESVKGLVDPRLAHLITGKIYEGKRESLDKILRWFDSNGVTSHVLASIRETVAGGLIIGGEQLIKHLTPVDMVMSAIIPAIESVMAESSTDTHAT